MAKYNRKYSKYLEPPLPLRQYLYETTIRPHLKVSPRPENYSYLMSKALAVMSLSIGNEEINRMLFVQWIAERLCERDEAFLIKALSEMMQETHDTDKRTEIVENNLHQSHESRNTETHISELIRLYKVLFENEFRLWSTIPFGYVCKLFGIKLPSSEQSNYALISASRKYHSIIKVKVATAFGSFGDLLAGFDNEIRNAGEGHDSWEISDKGTIVFKVLNPDTGSLKGKKEIDIKLSDFIELINVCRRTLWSLEVGTILFLINNPNISAKLQRSKIYKINEIERSVRVFAEERGFDLIEFDVSDDRSEVLISLKYEPIERGYGEKLYVGKVAAFDIININLKAKLKYQVLGIIQMLAKIHFDKGTIQALKVRLINKNDKQMGYVEYSQDEVQKFYGKPCKENIPIPKSGEIPDIDIEMALQLKVRYGRGKRFEKYLLSLPKGEIERIVGLTRDYE